MTSRNKLNGRRISIIGAGVSGQGLASLAARLGASVFVTDKGAVSEEARTLFKSMNIGWEEKGHSERCFEADLLVAGSGIPPHAPVITEAKRRGVDVSGELDFVAPWLRGKIIGVTGSNGKSTTTALLGHMLKKKGFSVAVAGNIGQSLADSALMEWDFIAVELSSFQLYWNHKLSCSAAIVTNLAPDHLDWHGSYDGYLQSKLRIIETLEKGGTVVCRRVERPVLENAYPGTVFATFLWRDEAGEGGEELSIVADSARSAVYMRLEGVEEKLFVFDELPLLGRHNIENASMAAAMLRLNGAVEGIGVLFAGFKGLPHRCEKVAEFGGILFVDDSKGTNVASTCTALTSIEGKKAIILGGQGKGEDYGPLAETVAKEAAAAVIIGEEKQRIADALADAGFMGALKADGLEDGVPMAVKALQGSGVVLLSPACTSWDMYPNYGARGDHFKKIVQAMRTEQ